MNRLDYVASVTKHHETALSPKGWAGVGLWFLVLGMIAAIASLLVGQESWWVHGAWCIAGLLILGVVLTRALRRGFEFVITDHLVMFTGAFALYFLFGASFMTFGPDEHVYRSLRYYNVDAITALKADAVNGIGFGLALIVAALSPRRWISSTARHAAEHASRIPAPLVLLVLLALGVGAYGYTLIYDFGFREGVVSGAVRAASKFSIVAVLLAASYAGPAQSVFRFSAVLLAAAIAFSGVLLFNKTQTLLPIGALVAGFSLVYRPRLVLPVGLIIISLVYLASSGPVAYGRNTMIATGEIGLSERLSLVVEGISATRHSDPLTDTSPWGRLSYVNAQGAGMDFYNQGMGGNEFELVPWVFVPRFVAPAKPIITEGSRTFHQKISGNEGSATGQGIFSSGYYSGGWLGATAAAIIAGWILAQTSAIASSIMAARATILLPFALYGVYIAFRIDGSFLSDYIGAFVFILYPAITYWFLRTAIRPRRAVS